MAGEFDAWASAVNTGEKYLTTIQTGEHGFIADEPASEGGTNLGPDPFELLAASLASCTTITLRMYIERKGWQVGKIETTIGINRLKLESGIQTTFNREIKVETLDNNLDFSRLEHVANSCPVHKVLSGSIYINTLIS